MLRFSDFPVTPFFFCQFIITKSLYSCSTCCPLVRSHISLIIPTGTVVTRALARRNITPDIFCAIFFADVAMYGREPQGLPLYYVTTNLKIKVATECNDFRVNGLMCLLCYEVSDERSKTEVNICPIPTRAEKRRWTSRLKYLCNRNAST